MDPYDSDSSLDEDFTETGVLLGYAAEEVVEDTISHLGGWPVCTIPHSRRDHRTDNHPSRNGSMTRRRLRATMQSAKSAIAR